MIAAREGTLAPLLPLLDDLGALKRTRCAHAPWSVATQLFARAWALLVRGEPLPAVADEVCALALVAARLGAIDGATLERAGCAPHERAHIVSAAFDDAAAVLDDGLRTRLRTALRSDVDLAAALPAPAFVDALARQPRAGATAPGTARLILEPAESHADHCAIVAISAALVAPRYGARGDDAVLFGLAHHLHNALLPDAGFAGEVLLGPALAGIMERCFAAALAPLAPALAHDVRRVRATIDAGAETPDARAFHAADVIDRVLDVRYHARAAAFEASQALEDRELVHAGPVQAFHHAVLAEAGLS